MKNIVLVASGGALGAALRWWLAGVVQSRAGALFPWGTLAVNVLGCFGIGLVMESAAGTLSFPPSLRMFLVIGVLGGFTTWSSFSYETMRMVEEGALGLAAANAFGTMLACFTATWLGFAAARSLS